MQKIDRHDTEKTNDIHARRSTFSNTLVFLQQCQNVVIAFFRDIKNEPFSNTWHSFRDTQKPEIYCFAAAH
jgi:hypothetical protein